MSIEDLKMNFLNSVVLYNNRLVNVLNITPKKVFLIFDLYKQSTSTVDFEPRKLKIADRRLGFINSMGIAIYAARKPLRQYKAGLNRDNVDFFLLEVPRLKINSVLILNRIKQFSSPEVANCLFNKYPTYQQACNEAIKSNGVVAFDRQFAVDFNGIIHYRNEPVGCVVNDFKVGKHCIEDINWNVGSEYLIQLIGNRYANSQTTIRTRGR